MISYIYLFFGVERKFVCLDLIYLFFQGLQSLCRGWLGQENLTIKPSPGRFQPEFLLQVLLFKMNKNVERLLVLSLLEQNICQFKHISLPLIYFIEVGVLCFGHLIELLQYVISPADSQLLFSRLALLLCFSQLYINYFVLLGRVGKDISLMAWAVAPIASN